MELLLVLAPMVLVFTGASVLIWQVTGRLGQTSCPPGFLSTRAHVVDVEVRPPSPYLYRNYRAGVRSGPAMRFPVLSFIDHEGRSVEVTSPVGVSWRLPHGTLLELSYDPQNPQHVIPVIPGEAALKWLVRGILLVTVLPLLLTFLLVAALTFLPTDPSAPTPPSPSPAPSQLR